MRSTLAAVSNYILGFVLAFVLQVSPSFAESSSVQANANPLAIAQDCLGAMARYRGGEVRALAEATADAERLLFLYTKDGSGLRGWPYAQELTLAAQKCGVAGSIDAFSDGTCNPPETPYMIQTGYSVTCLAQVAAVTKSKKYLELAVAAIEDSWGLGVTDVTCDGSYDYWYSYSANDRGRFVRNTNAIMGIGLLSLYGATSNARYRQRALAIAKAEHCEIQARNFGYFGIRDPRYAKDPQRESRRIENHIVHQIKFLQLVGANAGSAEAANDSKRLLDEFLTCSEPQCRPDNCAKWAVPPECRASASVAPCMDVSGFHGECDAVRVRFQNLNGFQHFLMAPP